MIYRVLTELTVAVHFAFLIFVVAGGFLARRWRWLIVPHLLAAAWGVYVEVTPGLVCPLTPLENRFRRLGGETGYSGEFIDHYVRALLYPNGLSRGTQLLLGAAVLLLNVTIYWVLIRRLARQSPPTPG